MTGFSRIALVALLWITCSGFTARAAEDGPETGYQLGPVTVLGDDTGVVTLGLGQYDVSDDFSAFAGSVEYRLGEKILNAIGPAVGFIGNVDGGLMGYVGLYADFAVGSWVATPMLGAGGYRQGESRDLGGTFQFRQTLDVAYRFNNGARIGARIGHISNANLRESNAGTNDVAVTVALPVPSPF